MCTLNIILGHTFHGCVVVIVLGAVFYKVAIFGSNFWARLML